MQGYTRQAIANRIGAAPDLSDAATASSSIQMIPFNFGTVNDNTNTTKSRRISRAGAFVVTAITGVLYSGSGSALTFSEAVSVEFWTNGNSWQEDAIPWDCIVGTSVQPFILPFQAIAPDGADLSIKLTNSGSGVNLIASIVLHGVIVRK